MQVFSTDMLNLKAEDSTQCVVANVDIWKNYLAIGSSDVQIIDMNDWEWKKILHYERDSLVSLQTIIKFVINSLQKIHFNSKEYTHFTYTHSTSAQTILCMLLCYTEFSSASSCSI